MIASQVLGPFAPFPPLSSFKSPKSGAAGPLVSAELPFTQARSLNARPSSSCFARALVFLALVPVQLSANRVMTSPQITMNTIATMKMT